MSFDDIDDEIDEAEDNIDHTYLTFHVAGEEYAVHVRLVTEIVRLQRSFAVPDVPSYIRGVINLRGKVIPLLDVRARFGLPDASYSDRTVIVVLELGDVSTGLIVDAVSEVAELPPDQIDTAHASPRSGHSSLVRGMAKRGERVSFVLDIPTLLADAPPAHALKNADSLRALGANA